jgi:hypothetical protein
MKSIISTLVIFLTVAAMSLQAQTRPGNGIQPFLSQYAEELNLTNDQMKELAELNMEYRQELRGNIQGRRGNRGQRGTARGTRRANWNDEWVEARSEYHTKVMDILNEDQVSTLKGIVQDRAENAHQFRMAQHEVYADAAGLEGEKRQDVINLMNDHSRVVMETRINNIETPGFGLNRADRFESRLELQNDLKELLTVSEYQKLQDVMGTRRFDNNGRPGRRGNSRFN